MARSDRRISQKLAHSSAKLGLVEKNSLYEIFHENTKLGPLTGRAYSAWILNFNRAHRAQQTIDQAYKVYTLMEQRELPRVEARTELERTIADRRSIRRFSGAPVGLEELARLLFFTYGKTDRRGSFRAVASGGALYPLELYVVALNVDGLEPGIYHYGAETGGLDVVKPGEFLATLKQTVTWEGIDIDNASMAIIMTASFRRNTIKYLDRGYRLILMEAGEAAQNLSLLATSMGLGACFLGGFNDDQLSDFLDIDGVDEAPLLPVLIGRPAPAVGGKGLPQPVPPASGS
jgi:SagB-type dehydrogenase family enzyme